MSVDGDFSVNLANFVNSWERQYIKPAMTKACGMVRNTAVQNAPKSTGELRNSINFEVAEDGNEGVVYANAEYAPYVEVGTGKYSTRGTGRNKPWVYQSKDGWRTTTGQRPQPYLEPAFQTNTSQIRDCFGGLF